MGLTERLTSFSWACEVWELSEHQGFSRDCNFHKSYYNPSFNYWTDVRPGFFFKYIGEESVYA